MASNFYKIGPKHIKIGFPTLYLSLSLLPSAAHVPSLLCPSGTNFIKSGVGTKFIAIVSGNKYTSLMNRRVGLSHPAPQIFEDYSNANDLRAKICEIFLVKVEQCSMNIPSIPGPCLLAWSWVNFDDSTQRGFSDEIISQLISSVWKAIFKSNP